MLTIVNIDNDFNIFSGCDSFDTFIALSSSREQNIRLFKEVSWYHLKYISQDTDYHGLIAIENDNGYIALHLTSPPSSIQHKTPSREPAMK